MYQMFFEKNSSKDFEQLCKGAATHCVSPAIGPLSATSKTASIPFPKYVISHHLEASMCT